MTLDQLVAFHAVATEGTFSAASAALHKSQPAVSKLVQNLEADLGLALFDRSAYRATLTDSGRLFLERTAQLLASASALRRFGLSLGGEAEPVVRLVLEAITPLQPVLAALREVREAFPSVRYELRTERLTGALQALEDGSADLAIAGAHGMDASRMVAHPFVPVRIIPVAHRDHPLAVVEPPVPAELLQQHAQVVLRDSARGELTQTVNVLQGGLRWSVTDVAAKLEIIHAGMGWGGLPEHVVAEALAEGSLRALDVREFHVRVFELSLVRRVDHPGGPVARALWSRLAARGS
jgi:DNA-binding transcriptional LysR family regulator